MTRSQGEAHTPLTLLLASLLFLNTLDYLTTSYSIIVGLKEANPFVQRILDMDFKLFTQIKLVNASVMLTLTTLLALLLETRLARNIKNTKLYDLLVYASSGVVGFYLGVVANNVLQILAYHTFLAK